MIISTSKYVKTNGDNPILPPLQMMPEAGVVTEQGGWGIQGPEEVWPHQRATPGFPLPCLPLPAGPVTEIPGPMESRPRREARAVTWERLGGKDEGGCLLPFPRYSVHTAGWRLACSLLPSTRWGASVRQWRCLVHYGDPSIQPSTWHTVSTLISDSVQGGPKGTTSTSPEEQLKVTGMRQLFRHPFIYSPKVYQLPSLWNVQMVARLRKCANFSPSRFIQRTLEMLGKWCL